MLTPFPKTRFLKSRLEHHFDLTEGGFFNGTTTSTRDVDVVGQNSINLVGGVRTGELEGELDVAVARNIG